MTYGMGLLLYLEDEMSPGVSKAVGEFDKLEGAADKTSTGMGNLETAFNTLSKVGGTLTKAVTLPIAGLTGVLVKQGIARASFLENSANAFSTLLGSVDKAKKYTEDLYTFAKTTPFSFPTLATAAQQMISFGIDAQKVEGILQALGDAAGGMNLGESGVADLANVLSTINAEGKVSGIRLQQLATKGFDAVKMIGNLYDIADRDKAREFIREMDASTFIDDFVRGIEEGTTGALGATAKFEGMMSKIKGTWSGALDVFRSAIANAGNDLIQPLLPMLTASLNNISGAIRNSVGLFAPMVNVLARTFNVLSIAIKVAGKAFAALPSPIQDAIGVFVGLAAALGPVLLLIGSIGKSFSKGGFFYGVGKALKEVPLLGAAFTRLRASIIPLFATIAILSAIWRTGAFGLRDFASGVKSNFNDTLTNSAKIADQSTDQMMKSIAKLRQTDTFWSNLTVGMVKVRTLWGALMEAFSSKDGFTISQQNFDKLNRLGLLPLIEAIFDIKYRWDFFKKGFIEGFNQLKTAVTNFFTSFEKLAKGTFLESILDTVSNFLQLFRDGDPEFIKKIGTYAGIVLPPLLALFGIVKTGSILLGGLGKLASFVFSPFIMLGKAVLTIFSGVFSVIGGIARVFGTIGGAVFGVLKTVIGGIAVGLSKIPALLGLISTGFKIMLTAAKAHPVILAISLIVAGLVALYNICEPFKDLVNQVGDTLKNAFGTFASDILPGLIDSFMEFGSAAIEAVTPIFEAIRDDLFPALAELGPAILEIFGAFAEIGGVVISALGDLLPIFMELGKTIINAFVDLLPAVMEIISAVVDVVSELVPVIGGVFGAIAGIIKEVVPIIVEIVKAVVPIVSTILSAIGSILKAVTPIIAKIISVVAAALKFIIPIVSKVVSTVLKAVAKVVDFVTSVVIPIIDLIVTVIGTIIEIVSAIVSTIISLVADLISFISEKIASIIQFFAPVFEFIRSGWESLKSTVADFVEAVTTNFNRIRETVSNIMSAIREVWNSTIGALISRVSEFATNAGAKFQSIKDRVSTVVSGIKSAWDSTIGSIVNKVTSGVDKIKELFQGVKDKVRSIIDAISNFSWSLPKPRIPKFNISGKFSLDPPSVPSIGISWAAKGGVFNEPTILGVGEAGEEAVMPLENNTGWITKLAGMIQGRMSGQGGDGGSVSSIADAINGLGAIVVSALTGASTQATPSTTKTPIQPETPSTVNHTTTTNNTTNTSTSGGNTDNSVVFESGAIQLSMASGSENDLEAVADKLMKIIAKKKQQKDLANYQTADA